MNTKQKKFAAYAALSVTFLTTHQAEAQVIYQDINPDMLTTGFSFFEYEIPFDFNEDGINECTLQAFNFTSSTTGAFSASIFLRMINYAEFLFSSGNIALLDKGDLIDSAGSWSNTESFHLMNFYTDDIPENWTDAETKFLGIRFLVDGNYHYGWIRLGIGSYNLDHYSSPALMIFDDAYESLADTPIIAGDFLPAPATKLTIIDSISIGGVGDAFMHFTHSSDESSISEYRLIISPDDELTFDQALALPPERYISVSPTSTDFTMQMHEDMLDYHGNPVSFGYEYRIFVLNIADGINATINTLSIPSNEMRIADQAADEALAINLIDVADNENASDLEIHFTAAKKEYTVSEYRIYLTSAISIWFPGEYEYEDFEGLDDTYYTIVIADGSEEYTVNADADQLDINRDSLLLNGDEYEALIYAVPDGYFANDYSTVEASYSELYSYPDTTDATSTIISSSVKIFQQNDALIINGLTKDMHYKIYTLTGQALTEGVLNSEYAVLNISDLSSGNYFIEIYSADRSGTFPFIRIK